MNKEESPIPIPPADQAWQSMREKLDVALPVGKNLPAPGHARRLWIKAAVTATTVATITTALWQYGHKHNGSTPASGNNTYDTSLTSTKLLSPATSANTYARITSKQDDTLLRDTKPSTINGWSGEQRDAQNSHLLSTPSQLLQTLSSSPTPTSLQSSAPSGPLRKSQSPQATPSTQTSQLLPISALTQSKQLSDSSQSSQLPQPLQAFASDQQHPAEKTPSQSTTAQQPFSKQQLPAKTYMHAGDHSSAKTESRPSVQLTMIQSPVVRYNTSLQHKADPLMLRQLSNRNAEKKWALYLQLNVPIPLSGDSSYFMGPDGKDQFYRNLIPAVRVERQLWKGSISLDIQPSFSTIPESNIHDVTPITSASPFDTSASLLKQSGWGLALQYQIAAHKKWQVGAGIQASFLQKAVMQQTISDSSNYIYTKIYSASTEDKHDLNKVRLYGTAELDYMAGKWQLGLRTLIPVTRVSKTRDISVRPVNVEFVLRRKLWTK